MSIDGMDELERKMRSLSKLNVKRETARTIQTVRDAAVNACPVGYGELRQSIFAEVIEKDDLVQGVCYTNKDYSIYVEFGTGPKGQENHAGTSPEHNPVYTQQPWWIHESQVDARIAEKYHWFHIDTPEGRFYQSTGQAAQPFMYPALKDNQADILKDFNAQLIVNLEGLIK
ncbi:MAG: HK97 gp10 family phage protein [Lachnospiraceae bacterium]|nr:HK97 gp10 family phage protein [Lachnospiraceae bacterium]